uniref:Expressed protein n=2 Tax=Oryza TaxID=4527 RepID=Q10QE2_ORYSJ|nr:expressed protein [Oryza sativa Japonica Group]
MFARVYAVEWRLQKTVVALAFSEVANRFSRPAGEAGEEEVGWPATNDGRRGGGNDVRAGGTPPTPPPLLPPTARAPDRGLDDDGSFLALPIAFPVGAVRLRLILPRQSSHVAGLRQLSRPADITPELRRFLDSRFCSQADLAVAANVEAEIRGRYAELEVSVSDHSVRLAAAAAAYSSSCSAAGTALSNVRGCLAALNASTSEPRVTEEVEVGSEEMLFEQLTSLAKEVAIVELVRDYATECDISFLGQRRRGEQGGRRRYPWQLVERRRRPTAWGATLLLPRCRRRRCCRRRVARRRSPDLLPPCPVGRLAQTGEKNERKEVREEGKEKE